MVVNNFLLFLFFQAEDGIRDGHVTGVQTCALPISPPRDRKAGRKKTHGLNNARLANSRNVYAMPVLRIMAASENSSGEVPRSEERRVGKEGRDRGGQYQ